MHLIWKVTLSCFILKISIISPSKYNRAFFVWFLSAALLSASFTSLVKTSYVTVIFYIQFLINIIVTLLFSCSVIGLI